ncbi:hypothetical protein MMC28_000605 [Mycoblastus sanguinarius]|nr:hypothetical protein [Mycoblastus sanguinarius]
MGATAEGEEFLAESPKFKLEGLEVITESLRLVAEIQYVAIDAVGLVDSEERVGLEANLGDWTVKVEVLKGAEAEEVKPPGLGLLTCRKACDRAMCISASTESQRSWRSDISSDLEEGNF